MLTYAAILVLPWLAALITTPLVARWARAHDWVDRPHAHKTHPHPVPMLGGVAVLGALFLGLGSTLPFSEPVQAALLGRPSLSTLALGLAVMVALGLYDDRKEMRAGTKLAGQILIAAGTWWLGFRSGAVSLPFGQEISEAALPSLLVTVAWIVIVTNAFNLIDGLDGLAVGLGIAASLTIFVLAASNGATMPVVAALALAGALAGFLRHNIPPARIFLGDAGSMGIGYATAVLSLVSSQRGPTALVLTVPLIALGLPVLDTVAAVVRRTAGYLRVEGRGGLRPSGVGRALFRPDRGHIHHLLMRFGWSERRVLFSLYALSALLCALALWTRRQTPELRWTIWLSLILGGVAAFLAVERRVERRESGEVPEPEHAEAGSRGERAAGGSEEGPAASPSGPRARIG